MAEITQEGARPRGVFISYRRGETNGQARALHDQLAGHFGKNRVFMDVDSISPGADFVEKINEAIDSSGVVLVLIGRDWIGSGGRTLNDPNDFVRLEIDAALQQHVQIIPILVERTPMPDRAELPEPLRPLANRHALDLENARWDSDVQRLVTAVEPYVDSEASVTVPGVEPRTPKQSEGVAGEKARGVSFSGRNLAVGITVLVVVVALVVYFITRPGPKPKPPAQLSVAHTVAAIVPDRMAEALLGAEFTGHALPSGVSASGPPLLGTYRFQNAVAEIEVQLSGLAPSIGINYLVFDAPGAAKAYVADTDPVGGGFRTTGTFASPGIGNSLKCGTSYRAASSTNTQLWSSDCLTASANVVDFVYVGTSSKKTTADDALVAKLTEDALRHVGSVAATAPKAPLVPPPGSLNPDAQFAQIRNATFNTAFEPDGLTNPVVASFSAGTDPPTGLINGSYITATFTGPDHEDVLYFYIFDTAQDAGTWFNTTPVLHGATTTSVPLDCSGFSQQAQCANYSLPASGTVPVLGLSQCQVLWGNVVIFGDSESTTNTQAGTGDIAVTLARSGVMYLDQLGGS